MIENTHFFNLQSLQIFVISKLKLIEIWMLKTIILIELNILGFACDSVGNGSEDIWWFYKFFKNVGFGC